MKSRRQAEYDRMNLIAAEAILENPEKFAAISVRWAEAFLARWGRENGQEDGNPHRDSVDAMGRFAAPESKP